MRSQMMRTWTLSHPNQSTLPACAVRPPPPPPVKYSNSTSLTFLPSAPSPVPIWPPSFICCEFTSQSGDSWNVGRRLYDDNDIKNNQIDIDVKCRRRDTFKIWIKVVDSSYGWKHTCPWGPFPVTHNTLILRDGKWKTNWGCTVVSIFSEKLLIVITCRNCWLSFQFQLHFCSFSPVLFCSFYPDVYFFKIVSDQSDCTVMVIFYDYCCFCCCTVQGCYVAQVGSLHPSTSALTLRGERTYM